MSAHAAKVLDGMDGTVIGLVSPANKDCVLTLEQVIKGGGAYLATASLFCRKTVETDPPEFRRIYSLDYRFLVLK